jgi:hypothetical protein
VSKPADTFRDNTPEITETDAIEAAKSARVVQSFNAHPIATEKGKVEALLVKWKLANGKTESFLLGPYASLVFRMM